LSSEIETCPAGVQAGEITFSVTEQYIAKAGIEPAELG
jgi:hypothetical protein